MSPQASLNSNKFYNFTGQISDLAHSEIAVIQPNVSITKASKLLMSPDVDYLIVQEKDIVIGMVSKAELLSYSLHKNKDLSLPVKTLINDQLVSVQKTDSVMEGLLFMLKHKLNYLLVMDDTKPVGVITQKDWVQAEIKYPIPLIRKIEAAGDLTAITALGNEAKKIIWNNYTTQGDAIALTNMVTIINDAVTKRIIQLSLDEMQNRGKGIPPVSFAWIGMGSEGRKAQTITSDQDNGLVFENVAPEKYNSVKDWFLNLSELICQGLNQSGVPLCEGNIMATNPELCNSQEKWSGLFNTIISNSSQKELLEASIYFDFRCIYGNHQLVSPLWDNLFVSIKENGFFMRELAQNMLEASRPPIKKWRWKITPHLGIIPKAFDIKREASAPLDAAIRLIALNHNITATHTLERLTLILEKGLMSKSLADEVKKAFDFVLRLRFRQEFSLDESAPISYHIEVSKLIPLQIRNLKDALKTIYELQDFAYTHIVGHKVPWVMR